MKKQIFKGCGTALVTPFNQDESINFKKLEELIDYQIKNNADAIIICGTTGESSTMSESEQKETIKFAVEKVNKRTPVIAGTGSNNTKHAINLSRYAQEVGADAVLVVTPYYNKTSQQGLYEHYKAISNSISIPVVLYNVPSRTGLNIAPETVKKLSEIENINSIKECNLDQMLKTKSLCGEDINIYSGNDHQVLPCLSYGGLGVISVMSNIIVKDVHKMVTDFHNENFKDALDMQIRTQELINGLGLDVNPIPIKTAMNLMKMEVGACRLPLVNTSEENIQKISEALERYGVQ